MKIFLSFLQSKKRYDIPAYGFWEYYIKNGIVEAGHSWDEAPDVDWALGIVPKSAGEQNSWKENAWAQTIKYLKKNPADIFLSYLYPEQIDTDAVSQIKKIGIPCVNFYCDNVRHFKNAPVEFSQFDLNWVPECKAVRIYQKAGFPNINLPMPIWLQPDLRILPAELNEQVTFIGSKDIQRQLFFERIAAKMPGLPLAIYGSGWVKGGTTPFLVEPAYTLGKKIRYQFDFIKDNGIRPYLRKLNQRANSAGISKELAPKIHGTTTFEKYNELTAGSMITVGVNRYPTYDFPLDRPDTYSRLRDIEAPMLGACYLTEYTEGIENLYDTNNEIAVYHSEDDFIENVCLLQKDKMKREKLRLNGQKRALSEHSVMQSLIQIIQKIT
jgi:hypothetical protein